MKNRTLNDSGKESRKTPAISIGDGFCHIGKNAIQVEHYHYSNGYFNQLQGSVFE